MAMMMFGEGKRWSEAGTAARCKQRIIMCNVIMHDYKSHAHAHTHSGKHV